MAGRASRNKFPSDAIRRDLGRPVAARAVLSTRSGQMARSLNSGGGWPISYCPVYGVYQRSSRAIFIKGLQNCNFIKAGQPQLPFCQASEGRVARARFRNFGAGSWPAASRNWQIGLPETIFRATAKASATASLVLASVVLALGGGRTGFPKQVSER